jgi:nitrate/TMAO reductase-like tetraheme cytochrome c subunit
MNLTSRFAAAIAVASGAAALLLHAPPGRAASTNTTDEIETCLSCHGDKDLTATLPSGEKPSLFVDRAVFEKSVHGARHGCTGCHPGHGEYPHPERNAKNLAEFKAGYRESCRSCHFDNYTKALDGVHYRLHAKGDDRTPLCVDCHGAHDIARPGHPRTRVSDTCGACHGDVMDVYAKSVHGKAILAGKSEDAPVCTDCHKSHDIANPRSKEWLLATPEMCGSCHANKELMAKYGLSPNVVKSYLSDFHGMTATLSRTRKDALPGAPDASTRGVTALCVDCHGVHDIASVRNGDATALKANLLKTCQKCHVNATPNFPAAWLSHYEPSWQKAPLVYAVRLFYTLFIPFVVGGLALQILLHVWRVVVNR